MINYAIKILLNIFTFRLYVYVFVFILYECVEFLNLNVYIEPSHSYYNIYTTACAMTLFLKHHQCLFLSLQLDSTSLNHEGSIWCWLPVEVYSP